MRIIYLILITIIITFSETSIAESDGPFTLYLVRHAEKQTDSGRDPELTEEGSHRSVQLAGWFRDKGLVDIWSSDYKRTRDTATPTATSLKLKVEIYNAGNQTILIETLLERQHNALVVGHSNTIPELARLLCECSIPDMEDSEHDRLIVISIEDGHSQTRTMMQNRLFRP